MKKYFFDNKERGHADHGWLKAYHSFSFANWYHPEKVNFGALRVLNDDTIAPGMGFGTHPHNNMEIITIPLSGAISHKDSMGNASVISSGEIQVMSAGKGVQHSEFNASKEEYLKLLQIWVFPDKENVVPRYQQMTIADLLVEDQISQILSPSPSDEGVWIHQDAWFHLLRTSKEGIFHYEFKKPVSNGLYMFVISGTVEVDGQKLNEKDALGVLDAKSIEFSASKDTQLLMIEVPLKF